MNSKFNGGLFGLIGIHILAFLLTVVTLGIGGPWAVCMVERWYAKHTVIDGRQLVFNGKGHQLWGKILLWLLLTVVTLGIFIFWYGIVYKKWLTKHTHFIAVADEEDAEEDEDDEDEE